MVSQELAGELDQFLGDMLAKRSPRLIVCCPPQEGKSEQEGAHPSDKEIIALATEFLPSDETPEDQ